MQIGLEKLLHFQNTLLKHITEHELKKYLFHILIL